MAAGTRWMQEADSLQTAPRQPLHADVVKFVGRLSPAFDVSRLCGLVVRPLVSEPKVLVRLF